MLHNLCQFQRYGLFQTYGPKRGWITEVPLEVLHFSHSSYSCKIILEESVLHCCLALYWKVGAWDIKYSNKAVNNNVCTLKPQSPFWKYDKAWIEIYLSIYFWSLLDMVTVLSMRWLNIPYNMDHSQVTIMRCPQSEVWICHEVRRHRHVLQCSKASYEYTHIATVVHTTVTLCIIQKYNVSAKCF